MKKDTTKINSLWRDFDSPDEPKLSNMEVLPNRVSDGESITIKLSGKYVQKSTQGVAVPPSASKFLNNQKMIDAKFNKQSSVKTLEQKGLYKHPDYKEWAALEKSLTVKELNIMCSFRDDVDMARNLNPARAQKFDLDITGNRRMATDFARIISKIAEDNSGQLVDGNDLWDMNKLIYRCIDNRNIIDCKSSRELESVVLILDSSPSCSRFAKLYSELAVVATKFSDVDMYNAPNARITHRYNSKKREFVVCMTLEDILNGVHKWKYFKNRVIMFFGDFDGIRVVLDNTFNNKVYYFCTEPKDAIMYELSHKNYNANNLTIFERVTNAKGFIKAMKKMK